MEGPRKDGVARLVSLETKTMERKIVWAGEEVHGRYHLEGTDIPLALIKADIVDGIDVLQQYSFLKLTENERDAIDAFPFPPIRDLSLRQTYIVMVLECPCGEDVTLYGEQNPQAVVDCVCGRSWSVGLSVTPICKSHMDGHALGGKSHMDGHTLDGAIGTNGFGRDRIESYR
jgi:hypothetical protein